MHAPSFLAAAFVTLPVAGQSFTVVGIPDTQNYSESYPADNLIEVTFDLMSRGTIGIGRATISGTIMPTAHQT